MKKIVIFLFVSLVLKGSNCANCPNTNCCQPKIYHPEADAKADIKAAVDKAAKEGKHVLLQIGGNWCVWCIRFNDKVNNNDTLKTELEKNYITYHLNYSKENMNEDVLASLGYPNVLDFLYLLFLDAKGNRLHTQSSGYLESGKGHGTQQVLEFFSNGRPQPWILKSYVKKPK